MSSTKLIKLILKRDEGRCVIAGPLCFGTATVADHRANRGIGGSTELDDPRNLIASCPVCNMAKEDATGGTRAYLERRGIRVRKLATNAATLAVCQDIPVMYPNGDWFELTAEGERIPVNQGIALELIATFVGPVRTDVDG